jgi:hypothetical protein
MSMSLRDQLLQASWVREKQAKESERQLRNQQRGAAATPQGEA